MEQFLNIFLPVAVISILSGIYIWFLSYIRIKSVRTFSKQRNASKRNLPFNAPLIPYMNFNMVKFYNALKIALPTSLIIYCNVPIEMLFEPSRRCDLRMRGQYADFVIFSPTLMPILAIDLFDAGANLNDSNKLKNVSKEILKNSGIPVLDYSFSESYETDELRNVISNLLNHKS